MARSFHDVVHGTSTKRQRTFQPVRRKSYHRGERERRIWRSIDKREIGARLRAAEEYDRDNREAGKRNGPLGHVGLEVLRQLYRIADYKTGRLEPSIDYIRRSIGRSRSAVCDALAALKRHGFIDWIRRTQPVENEGAGPQVEQIPNAYWFSLPKAAAEFVKRLAGRSAPAPQDATWRAESAAADLRRMIDSLPLPDRVRATIENTGLRETLARMSLSFVDSANPPGGQNPAEEI
jgi:hypothetical protein